MKSQSIIQAFTDRPLVFDGAMGTLIYERGVFINACYDELCLSRPELISQIHQDYVAAGADVIETNTFGANRIRLGAFGLADKVEQINRAGVALARQGAADNDIFVAASVGPCLAPGQDLSGADADEIRAAFTEQLEVLAQARPDLVVLESFHSLAELQMAAAVADGLGLTVLASFALSEQASMPAETVAATLDADWHVHAIGLNCGLGPPAMLDPLRRVLGETEKPVVVMPNAGGPREIHGRMLYFNSPEYFTEYAKRFVEMGARGVGGCCGTGPDHVRMAARAIHALSGVKRHVEVQLAQVAKSAATVEVIAPAEKSRFAKRLVGGEFVTSVEILPPRTGGGLGKFIDKARRCGQAGVDAINIPDGPRASARISVLVAAMAVERDAGIEALPHYCCRDRNLIGMQADLLGGYAAGLANWLLITGDPPKLGEYPDTTGVFDLDAIGLTQLVNNLNHGLDAAGLEIDPPTGMFIGVGANPVAVEMEREIERYFRKIDAGAEFAITQPVFDPEGLLRFLDRVGTYHRQIPVLAGVWPLLSYRNAEFLATEVPGVVMPQWILDRMKTCTTREDGRAMGVEIARQIVEKIRPRVAGLQVSAPLGNVEMALDVLGLGEGGQ
jgi:homocysteine S-methyltransferase